MCLVLFTIFYNTLEDGNDCTLTKAAADTRLNKVADALEDMTRIQKNPDKLKKKNGPKVN